MNVNIKNVLRNIKDKITFLNVVYESISNSIEANSTVINIFFRKTDSIIEGEYLSDGFSITDNGDGFNKENRDSFLEYYTDHKLELGCKGVGRFTWLKVFGDVKIESYVEEKLVTSHFHEGYNDEFFENDYQEKPNYTTKIVFNNCFLAQKELLKLDLKEIKNKILEHFVIKFSMLNNSKRSFVINIGIENEKEKTTITNGDLFELNKIEFELEEFNSPISFCLYYSINDLLNDSKIVLCANKRAIEDINKTKKLINDLCDKKSIICFIEAKYLDDIVNDTRTGFLFSKNNEQTITKQKLIEKIESVLKNIIYQNFPEIKNRNIEIQNSCIEEYPYLKKYISKDESIIKNKDIIIKDAQKQFDEEKEKVRKEFKKTLSNPSINEEELIEKIATINDFSNKELVQYILYRQQIIDCLKKMNNNNVKQEALLHNLFIPMGEKLNNSLVDRLKNNIWLLDDKFMSCENLFSDVKVKTIKKLLKEKNEDFGVNKEPDLTIFYKNKTAVVVEFKAPGAKTSEKLGAIPEINRNNGIIAKNISNISVMFSYIITKFNDELIEEINLQQGIMEMFTNSKDPIFYYYNNNIRNDEGHYIPCHKYILSTESVCNDADERNKLFIDILNKEK